MKYPTTGSSLNLLLVLSCIHAWPSIIVQKLKSSSHLGSTARDDVHGIIGFDTPSEQRIRFLWSQQRFQTANNLVTGLIQGVPAGLKPGSYENDQLAGHLFASLFSSEPNDCVKLKQLSPPINDSFKTKKRSFALTVAYLGSEFCGWQTQPNNTLPSVQASLEAHLALMQKCRVDVRVCGRTDAGVHAIGQVCRYRTELDIDSHDVQRHIDRFPFSNGFRCLHVQRVSSKFHPGFGATCRAYAYVIDPHFVTAAEVDRLDTILRELEYKTLDYYGFSYGKVKTQSTNCTLYCARAISLENGGICIQLAGDRFLRRMVRLLCRRRSFLAFEQEPSSLIPRITALDRTLCSQAAPPDGLIFVTATYEPISHITHGRIA
ncbi:tRNA pseudouridine synthase [Fragilaria crotonensis]|nr:tRNA pseudouridine synthase [Fragilaria crotonensis]